MPTIPTSTPGQHLSDLSGIGLPALADAIAAAINTPPAVSAVRSTNQSLSNATDTVVTFPDTEEFDVGGLHSVAANQSRLTIVTAGKYLVVALVRFAPNATGVRAIEFKKSGSFQAVGAAAPSVGASLPTDLCASMFFNFAAADYIEISAHQTSGGALNITNGRLQAFRRSD